LFDLQWKNPGIELLLTDFTFQAGNALLPDQIQSFSVCLPFRTKMNGINYYPGISAQTREHHYTTDFRSFYLLFQVIPEDRPMELNTILIHSPSKEALNKKNNVLCSICRATSVGA